MTLVAVFQWVLYSTLAGSVAAALVLLVKALSRNRFNAGWHYLIWFIVLFRLAVPCSFGNSGIVAAAGSVVKIVGLAEHSALNALFAGKASGVPVDRTGTLPEAVPATPTHANQSTTTDQFPTDSTPAMPAPASSAWAIHPFDLDTLALIWLAGAAVTGAVILISYRRLMVRVAREPRSSDPELLAIVDSARAELGIRATVPVILDSAVGSPALVGLFVPRLLMPADLPTNLSREAKRNIVMHELAHLKRGDILVNWLTTAFQILHWFNPLIWHAFGIMRQDCEAACDATALAHISQGERRSYGQTIIDLLQFLSRPVPLPGTTHLASKTGIKRRMAMIAKSSKKRSPWSVAAIIVTVVVVVGAVGVSGARAFVLNHRQPTPAVAANQGANTNQNPSNGNQPTNVSNGVPGGVVAYTRSEIAAKLAGEKNTYDITWSPDKSAVVFIREGGQNFPTGYVWKVGDAEAKSIGQVSSVTEGFIWAPNSKHFLIAERVGGPSVLTTVVSAADLSRNPAQIHSVTQPIWGPDSNTIAVGCEETDKQGTLWTTLRTFKIGETDSTLLVKLPGGGVPITAVSWTGTVISYTAPDGNGGNVSKTIDISK